MTRPGPKPHAAALLYAREYRAGLMDRRTFLARATALGVAIPVAHGLIGLPAPARAGARPRAGGTLRIQMDCHAPTDPRRYDRSDLANATRGIAEYLVEVQPDGALRPMLLAGWRVNGEATEYLLNLRPGVMWNNGAPFTAEDVEANILGWCDASVPGNSMAARMAALMQGGRAAPGAVEVLDRHSLRLRLGKPDGTLMLGMADYPAAIQHRDLIGTPVLEHGIGTGAFRIDEVRPGERIVLSRNPDHGYWGAAYLDRAEFLDHGPDPAAWLAGARADAFDMTHETVSGFVDAFTALGWVESTVATSSTVVIRPNREAEVNGIRPYADPRVRRALALAVDNAIALELGLAGRGQVSTNNYHVAQGVHPDHADFPPHERNIPEARRLMEAAGMTGFEHDLVSLDDDYRRNTADAVAAQLRDAGFRVKRTLLPTAGFWAGWTGYPFSATDWNHRETGIQLLNLGYRSDAAWNETGFRDAAFDALLDKATAIADSTARRAVMGELQRRMVEDGTAIIPYWRALCRHHRPGLAGAGMHPKFEINIHHLGWT
ncbi:ABC transporter substrate-binding protein [Rhodovulum strictum]|uniref:Diguanylate cyclase n=1 Tax=Rhodovulum strictum TaxID=58314 RepID=A0A844BH34_9RHOB|nr:ABC transporter substrate-binding protein [Rhodovulum strictum]MRH20362.1 diguanylate cyclase [Rhodovulum strictum]